MATPITPIPQTAPMATPAVMPSPVPTATPTSAVTPTAIPTAPITPTPVAPQSPITMTAAQYQAKYGIAPTPPSAPITMTAAQYQQKYGVAPTPPNTAQDNSTMLGNLLKQSSPISGFTNPNNNVLTPVIGQIGQDFKNAYNSIVNPTQADRQSPFNVAANVTQALGSVFTRPISAILAPTIQKISDVIVSNPHIVDGLNAVNNVIDAHPQASKDIGDAFNAVLNSFGLVTGAESMKPGAISPEVNTVGATSFPKDVLPPEEPVPKTGLVSDTNVNNPSPTLQSHLNEVSQDWVKPTTQNIVGYNDARAILAKNPEVTMDMAKAGLNPFGHIDENGKFETMDTVENLRADNAKASVDMLRPSLQMADYTTPKMPVSELPNISPETVSPPNSLTPDVSTAIQNIINKKVASLQEKYPDGMTTTNRLDEKIAYGKNSGYNPAKPADENNGAIANRALANAMEKSLHEGEYAPNGVDVRGFDAVLAKNYKMADYLESINGKKAPVSGKLALARMAVKFGSAKLFSHFGGDIVSAFAGYQIGKYVERIVENMTNPMREQFLNNLEKTNPEAFKSVQKYLATRGEEINTTLRLPVGTNKTPIPLQSPEIEPSFKTVKAKAVSIKNPKTGRYEKAYTSEPK